MKNKLYSKQKNKKSIASIFLAALLALSFNSTPILAVSNYMRKSANAYKSEQKYVYYPTTSTTSSDKFTQFIPSALTNYVSSTGTNFNLLEYYNSKFTPLFTKWADDFFSDNSDSTYAAKVETFLREFDRVSVSDFYEVNKDDYENCKSIRDFVEYFAMNDMVNTSTGTKVEKLFDTKSEFYQAFFNYVSGKLTGSTEQFTEGDGVDAGATAEQFYAQSKSYKMLKELLDKEIAKDIAIVSHDGTTQNVNVAALIAEAAPTFIDYNYASKSYTNYITVTENAKHVQHTPNAKEAKDAIYYFGYKTNIVNSQTYKDYKDYFQETSGKENIDILYYYPTNSSHFGYIDQEHTTYYKYQSMPYAQSNSKYMVYILNNNPTVAEQDTYNALYFNVISQKDLDEDTAGLYVQMPYEDDELYFKAIYNNSLYNSQYDFETFCEMFAPDGNSIIYFKLSSSSNYKVYIDKDQLEAFQKEYATYPYIIEGVDINKYDYTKIESTSNYYRQKFDLYFENTKEYFVDAKKSYLTDQYETVVETAYTLTQKEVPSTQYDGNVYALKLTEGLDDVTGTQPLDQLTLDTYKSFYIAAPAYHYENLNISSEEYALYYKHTSIYSDAIYVVDDSVDETESAIYNTLNYFVITTDELKTNNMNYIAVAEGDPNFTKSFSLYYKYERDSITTQVYVLDDTDSIDEDIKEEYDNNNLKVIKTKDLVNYTLLSKTEASSYDEKYAGRLYYKLADVFVQNLLTGTSAIYIVDDNISNTDKSTYGLKSYTPITSEELKANADFYRIIESKDPNYNESFTKLYYKYKAAEDAKKVVYTIDQIDTTAADYDFNDYELITSGDDYEAGVEKYYKKLYTTNDNYVVSNSYYYFKSPEISLTANSYYAISFYVNTTKTVEASVYVKDTSGIMEDIAITQINTNGEWKQYYMFLSTDSVSASKVNIYLYLGDENNIAGSKVTDVTYTPLQYDINSPIVYDEHKVYYVEKNGKYVIYSFNENDWNKVEDKVSYSEVINGQEFVEGTTYYQYNSANEQYEVYTKNPSDWETQTVTSTTIVEKEQLYDASLADSYYTDPTNDVKYEFNAADWREDTGKFYYAGEGDLFIKTTSSYEILKGDVYGETASQIELDVHEEYYSYDSTNKRYAPYVFNINHWTLSNETLLSAGVIYDEDKFYFYDNNGTYVRYEFNAADWTASAQGFVLNSGVSLFTATLVLKDDVKLYVVTYSPTTIFTKNILTTKFVYKDGATPIFTRNNQTVSGSAVFNELKIASIGVTDYNKYAINDTPVQSTQLTEKVEGQDEPVPVEGKYADEYNNELILVNKVEAYKEANKFNYKTTIENEFANWNNMFDFEDDTLQSKLTTEKLGTIDETTDGYNMYDDSFTALWRYYISRDSKIEYTIEQFRQAYNNGDLDVSITNLIEKTKVEDVDDEEKDKVITLDGKSYDLTTKSGKESLLETLKTLIDNDDKVSLSGDVFTIEDVTYDVTKAADRTSLKTKAEELSNNKDYIESPFKKDNFALKLENKNTNTALGITSNAFTVKRMDYLRITVWVYSPDTDGTVTVAVNSVQKRQNENEYGKLLSSSVSVDANIASYTNTVINEYGWMPVYLYIEGSSLGDQDCYLVLSAGKDSTVYFDNISIERITSALYDTANADSDSKTCALSLSPTDSLISTGVSNGNFDLINVTSRDVPNANDLKIAESWTVESGNSKNVNAGVMSLANVDYFGSTHGIPAPVDGINKKANIYVIDAESSVISITGDTINNYKNTYKFYSASISLSANSVYKLTFDFYATSSFNGTLVSNIYSNSKLGDEYLISSMCVSDADITDNTWHTYTYYIATSTSSTSVYLELGIENANGLSFFKYVSSTKETAKTFDEFKAEVYKEAGVTESSTTDIYKLIKDARFVNYADPSFSIHKDNKAENEDVYSQQEYTHSLTTTNKYTVGQNGAAVATFYDTLTTTTHSVTIDKTTYYIGEVYEVEYSDTTYYVHRTLNQNTNKYVYKMYSDAELTTEVTKLGEHDITISALAEGVKVTANEVDYTSTKTTYRLFTFADCTVEVTEISGKDVKVESLKKVVVGTEEDNDEYNSTKKENNSYVYSFKNDDVNGDYIINNVIIPSAELKNAQSENVFIMANSYETDYQTLEPLYKKSLSKSAFYSLRIYVKTSDFASDDFGLNINISALNIKWTNINTTEATNADEFGFVCYEVLIKTNSSDSISNLGVTLSLGDTSDTATHTGQGYAIISAVELVNYATEAEFNHYAETAEKSETVQKKYFENSSSSSTSDSDSKEADDKNSLSWATFFFIFSSLLLVLVLAVALVAIFLKKHPIKFAKKYKNDHNKDIEIIKVKKSKTRTTVDEIKEENDNDGIL